MQAILNVKINEIDDNFLYIIKQLLSKKVEVVIMKNGRELEEFNKNPSLEKNSQVTNSFVECPTCYETVKKSPVCEKCGEYL